MNGVDDYIARFDGEKREWLETFVAFMRETYPELPERISYGMPMWKFGGTYVAFSVARDHFTFHTLDFDVLEALKAQLPGASFGRGSAKVKFAERAAIPVLRQACRTIVERHTAGSPPAS